MVGSANYFPPNPSNDNIQDVIAKTFEPNISVILQRIFVKFNADILDGKE
jgi:hypothetical protein